MTLCKIKKDALMRAAPPGISCAMSRTGLRHCRLFMRMIRRRQCLMLEPAAVGEVR